MYRPALLKWLLDSDPAIRWQVMRDLTDEALEVIAAERSRVGTCVRYSKQNYPATRRFKKKAFTNFHKENS